MIISDSDRKRFWSKVDVKGDDDCWNWKASIFKYGGYGQFWINYTQMNASRVAYMMTYGTIESTKILVLHKCDNKLCCNPSHLYLGNHSDNMSDTLARTSVRRGRYTKLKDGELWLMRKLFDAGINRTLIGKMFKMSRNSVYYLLSYREQS